MYGKCTNKNSIGIEICSNSTTKKVGKANDDTWFFTEKELNLAVELVNELMKEYDIDYDHVIRHYDVTGKLCPGIVGWNEDSGNVDYWCLFKGKLSDKKDDYETKYFELLNEYNKLKDKYNAICNIVKEDIA